MDVAPRPERPVGRQPRQRLTGRHQSAVRSAWSFQIIIAVDALVKKYGPGLDMFPDIPAVSGAGARVARGSASIKVADRGIGRLCDS